MLDTTRDMEITLDCNELKAKDLFHKFLLLVLSNDIDSAMDFLAPQFTWTGVSLYTDKNSVRDILASQMLESKKYIFHKEKIKFQRLRDTMYLILLPITIQSKDSIALNIVSTLIVDTNIEKIVSITLPIENKEILMEDHTVGNIYFYLDDKLTIKKVDDEISHFLSFSDGNEFLDYFGNGFINVIKREDQESFLKLVNTKNKYQYITCISVMNKIGEFIEIVFEIRAIEIDGSKFEISATIHESMSLDDLNILNGKRFSRLKNILNNLPTPFFYKNTKGEYLGFNNSYLKLLGVKNYYSVVGKTDYDFLSKEKSDTFREEDNEVIKENKSITKYSKVGQSEDITDYYQYTKSPLIEKGEVVGVLCFLTDVSNVKNLNNKLIKSQSELNFIFNNSDIAYFIKDIDLRFKRVNETFLKNNPYELSDIIGRTSEELFNNAFDLLHFPVQEREIFETKKPFKISQFRTGRNGNKYYFSIIESPLFDDDHNVTGLVGSVENITASVERQIKLESKYRRTMKLITDDDFLSFVRIDLENYKVVEFQSVNDIGLGKLSKINDNMLQFFIKNMLYEDEKEEARRIFNCDFLKASFTSEGKFSCKYTFSPSLHSLNVANIDLTFNINPSNNHREVFIYAIDVTKRYHLDEIVKCITKMGYDFIVKVNILIDRCEFLVFDEKLYPFGKTDNTFSINDFLAILDKYNDLKLLDKGFIIEFIKAKLKAKDEFKYSFNTSDGRSKSLVVRSLNREKETYLLSLTDTTDITMKDKILQEKLKISVIEAENANGIKSDFLARMSHDMRTPLSGIMGLADFGIAEELNDQMKGYFSKIKLSSTYLLTLLNDVLDMQSIEKGKIKIFPKAIIAEAFIREVETIVMPSVKAKNISLNVIPPMSGPKYLFDDPVRICQILVNILNNAIKYTGEQGHITYSTQYKGGIKHIYKIVISDDGVGMSNQFQKHMFESFTTETNQYSAIEGGTGLGLAISKNIVNLMGGHIECDSTINVGTTFTIYIPTHPIREQEYLKKMVSKDLLSLDKLKGKRILVCEDNKINIMIIKNLLLGKGLVVDVAINGKIGVEKARNNKYDAIFMDIKMPIMDGLTCASLIRKTNKKIPIIALSANAYKEDVAKSINVGMNAHLSKPINKDELFTTLCHYLK